MDKLRDKIKKAKGTRWKKLKGQDQQAKGIRFKEEAKKLKGQD